MGEKRPKRKPLTQFFVEHEEVFGEWKGRRERERQGGEREIE